MGVIHKFSQEVVDFVLQQKKDNSYLGCRRLADLTTEKFQIKVSKSSVNNILKLAELSNPVGRPYEGKQPKKFKIPQSKKKELFENLPKVGLSEKKTSLSKKNFAPSKKPAPQKEIEKEKIVPEPKVLIPKKEEEVTDKDVVVKKPKDVALPLMEDPIEKAEKQRRALKESSEKEKKSVIQEAVYKEGHGISEEEFLKKTEKFREDESNKKKNLIDGAGCVFLKAAQWEMSRKSALGNIFKKHLKISTPENFDELCNCLIFLRMLGAKCKEDLPQFKKHALWLLNGLEEFVDGEEVFSWTEEYEFLRSAGILE